MKFKKQTKPLKNDSFYYYYYFNKTKHVQMYTISTIKIQKGDT